MERHRAVQLARLVWRVYGFAAAMAACAIIPGCNFLYSGHGGPAWLILFAVFPFTLLQLWRIWRAATPERRPEMRRFAAISLVAYLPLSFGAAAWGAASIKNTFGLSVEPLFLWGFYIFPLGIPIMGHFFGL